MCEISLDDILDLDLGEDDTIDNVVWILEDTPL